MGSQTAEDEGEGDADDGQRPSPAAPKGRRHTAYWRSNGRDGHDLRHGRWVRSGHWYGFNRRELALPGHLHSAPQGHWWRPAWPVSR